MIQEALENLKNVLNYRLSETIKNVNSKYSKEPIDTGLMLQTTKLVSIEVDTTIMDININIHSQEYLKFVENGWGSNRKYGERKVREDALNHPDVKYALSKLYKEIINIKIFDTLKNKGIQRATYKV